MPRSSTKRWTCRAHGSNRGWSHIWSHVVQNAPRDDLPGGVFAGSGVDSNHDLWVMRLSAVVSGDAIGLISAVHADHGCLAASHLLCPVPGNLVTNSVTRSPHSVRGGCEPHPRRTVNPASGGHPAQSRRMTQRPRSRRKDQQHIACSCVAATRTGRARHRRGRCRAHRRSLPR